MSEIGCVGYQMCPRSSDRIDPGAIQGVLGVLKGPGGGLGGVVEPLGGCLGGCLGGWWRPGRVPGRVSEGRFLHLSVAGGHPYRRSGSVQGPKDHI